MKVDDRPRSLPEILPSLARADAQCQALYASWQLYHTYLGNSTALTVSPSSQTYGDCVGAGFGSAAIELS